MRVWNSAEQESYVEKRVGLHQQAATDIMLDEELDLCTPEERWQRNDKWAVVRPGLKRALRLVDTKKDADALAITYSPAVVEYRPGEPKHCQGNYCGVAEWCSQWKSEPVIRKLLDD